MATLRLYISPSGQESIVICTDAEVVDELFEDETLVESVELEGDFSSWPTDRGMVQER